MKNISTLFSVMLLVSLFLTGCKNIPPVTSGVGSENMTQGDDFNKYLKIDNVELAGKLAISNVKSRAINGLLEVNVELASRYEKSLQLQYHFNWFDKDGFVVESRKTPWKPIELHGAQKTTVRGLAPNIKVTSFNIYVRKVPERAYKF